MPSLETIFLPWPVQVLLNISPQALCPGSVFQMTATFSHLRAQGQEGVSRGGGVGIHGARDSDYHLHAFGRSGRAGGNVEQKESLRVGQFQGGHAVAGAQGADDLHPASQHPSHRGHGEVRLVLVVEGHDFQQVFFPPDIQTPSGVDPIGGHFRPDEEIFPDGGDGPGQGGDDADFHLLLA